MTVMKHWIWLRRRHTSGHALSTEVVPEAEGGEKDEPYYFSEVYIHLNEMMLSSYVFSGLEWDSSPPSNTTV